ncbi:hypothetical protein ACFRNT_10570 [Streptomyces sp. NPDC056697]|uniref:hypothetical protein n=1 Tax=Streptomyces sp. NPDC056697 TaxID=3345915 RepID=UPI00369FF8C1
MSSYSTRGGISGWTVRRTAGAGADGRAVRGGSRPALLEPVERELNAKVMRGSWPPSRVRPARLGHAATALGAIAPLQREVAGAAPLLR